MRVNGTFSLLSKILSNFKHKLLSRGRISFYPQQKTFPYFLFPCLPYIFCTNIFNNFELSRLNFSKKRIFLYTEHFHFSNLKRNKIIIFNGSKPLFLCFFPFSILSCNQSGKTKQSNQIAKLDAVTFAYKLEFTHSCICQVNYSRMYVEIWQFPLHFCLHTVDYEPQNPQFHIFFSKQEKENHLLKQWGKKNIPVVYFKSGYSYFFIQKLAIEKILKICSLHFSLMNLPPKHTHLNLKKKSILLHITTQYKSLKISITVIFSKKWRIKYSFFKNTQV